MNIRYILPRIITCLEEDILIGDMYDGELIVALKNVSKKDWNDMVSEKYRIKELISNTDISSLSGIQEDVKILLNKLEV